VKRLDYTRRIRTVPGHARNAAEAILSLVQVTFERQRLESERKSLERRIRSIETRLNVLNMTAPQGAAGAVPPAPRPPRPAPAVPFGVAEVTLQY
jgi:hypothetical protein